MPLRDDRRGKRATVGGDQPLRPSFPASPAQTTPSDAGSPADATVAYHAGTTDLQPTLAASATSPEPAPARTRVLPVLGLQSLVSALGLGRPEAGDDVREPEATGSELVSIARGQAGCEAPAPAESTFAGELARLLPPREGEAARADAASGSVATHDDARAVSLETKPPELPACDTARLPDVLVVGASEAAEPAGRAQPVCETQAALLSSEVLASGVAAFRRAQPPLTRLPLRPMRPKPAWPLLLSASYEDWNDAQRHEFLRGCARDPAAAADETILSRAYREENGSGRILALKALALVRTETSRDVFLEALRRGGDDERALAVDALAERGERGALVEALSDRVEAIAARAALAYLPGRSRAEFEAELTPLVDRARLDAILVLLAGVIL